VAGCRPPAALLCRCRGRGDGGGGRGGMRCRRQQASVWTHEAADRRDR
jgi:hypothetical protein